MLKATARYEPPGPGRSPTVAATIWEHAKRNYALRLAGLLRVVCPVMDGSGVTGISIFDASPEDVERIMAGDPGVIAGLFTYEIHPTATFPDSNLASREGNGEQSRRLYEELFGRGNLDVADEILASNHVSHGAGAPPETGTEGIKRQAERLRRAMPNLRVELKEQLADGELVASRWTGSGTFSGSLSMPSGPVAGNGKPITFDEIRIDRYTNGRIAESWFIPDRFTLFLQMGLLAVGPPAGPSK